MTECLIYTLFISIPPENVRGYRNKTLAWNKLITFQQCPYDERCTKNGLHGHHPRDCLYYLRDYNIYHLKQLLDMHNVEYETEIPEYKQEGNILFPKIFTVSQFWAIILHILSRQTPFAWSKIWFAIF